MQMHNTALPLVILPGLENACTHKALATCMYVRIQIGSPLACDHFLASLRVVVLCQAQTKRGVGGDETRPRPRPRP